MKNKMINALMFAFGAAVGSVITWKITKTKYEKIAQEEIDSVKEAFARREKKFNATIQGKPDLNKLVESLHKDTDVYKSMVQNLGYSSDDPKKGKAAAEKKAYVIEPEDFGDCYEYETVTLIYYADGVLADEDGEPIGDIDYILGENSLDCMGEYVEDVLYVCNDSTRSYYEVINDERNYWDLKPMAAADED